MQTLLGDTLLPEPVQDVLTKVGDTITPYIDQHLPDQQRQYGDNSLTLTKSQLG